MKRFLFLFTFAFLVLSFWRCSDEDVIIPDDTSSLTLYDFPAISHFSDFPHDSVNPVTLEGIELGRKLYFDATLSSDYTIACSNCHQQAFSFGDNQSVSGGVDDVPGLRNSPPLINLAWFEAFNWNGKEVHVRDQNIHPVPSELEMNLPWSEAVQRMKDHEDYPALFEEVFPGEEITKELITKALEQFQLIMLSYESPYDDYLKGSGSLSINELNGLTIFTGPKGGCFRCHDVEDSPELFVTDRITYANNGLDTVATLNDFVDVGRGEISEDINDNGKFRIPTLRNLGHTAPFMHDGRFATLDDVIEMYNRGPAPSLNVDIMMMTDAQTRLDDHGHWGLNLTQQEKDDLKAFLLTMTDDGYLDNSLYWEP
ncbi:MAG: cytochrome-c peroxidase [Bacteroidetes bacterium]|nr:cytochrome-c peroxidase [Bacteroidota bacterium]